MKRQVFGILIALVLVLSFGFTVPALSSVGIGVYVDVKPMSCPNPLNVCRKGVLPVAILGTDEFDVTTVDPETIRLNLVNPGIGGVPPLRWAYEDVATPYLDDLDGDDLDGCHCHELGPDGYLDLVLKFDTRQLVDMDLSEHGDGDVVDLQILGNLLDGSTIVGYDAIVVINKMINGES